MRVERVVEIEHPGLDVGEAARRARRCVESHQRVDQRAGAVVGEQFEQHRVRHLAVEDDDALDALLERVDAGLDLRDHAAGDGAVGDQPARVVDRQFLDQLLRSCRARPARR